MRWSVLRRFGILGLLATSSLAQADQDYGVLIISRERLEVPTSCEIGIYIQDELAARLFQEQTTSFNLPAGDISVRLRLLPGQAPGCGQGLEAQQRSVVHLKAGDIQKFRIAQNLNGMYLKPASLGY